MWIESGAATATAVTLLTVSLSGQEPAGSVDDLLNLLQPPDPITGNGYEMDLPQMSTNWADAIDRFERSGLLKRIFSRDLLRNYTLTKRQEMQYYAELSDMERRDLYLDTV